MLKAGVPAPCLQRRRQPPPARVSQGLPRALVRRRCSGLRCRRLAPGQPHRLAAQGAGRGGGAKHRGLVRRAGGVGGLDPLHLRPVHAGTGRGQGGAREARHRGGLELGRELLQRQPAPEVGGGGVPGAALLARDEAVGQPAHVVLPGRVVHHGEHQARGVDVAVGHEPPPVVARLGAEGDLGALPAQARLQDLCRLGQPLLALRHVAHALEDVDPVDHGAGGPLVGRDREAAQQAALGLAVARQRLDGGELAHVQVFLRRPEVALDAAFDKRGQAALHRGAHGVAQGEGRVQAGGLVGGRQQVGREDVAAAGAVALARREVAGQAVGIEVGRNLREHALPQLAVAQPDGLAGLLLQAGEGVAGKPVAHAGQALGQFGLQGELEAAPDGAVRGQTIGRRRHGQAERAVDLHQCGLLHGQRHGGDQPLVRLECVARAAHAVFRLDLPQQGLSPREGTVVRAR
jgi:hypothetical protein